MALLASFISDFLIQAEDDDRYHFRPGDGTLDARCPHLIIECDRTMEEPETIAENVLTES